MIPTAVSMLHGRNSWLMNDGPFGQASCKLLLFSQGTSIACSILSLTVLARERFFAVVFPLWNVITIRSTLWSIVVICIAALALSSPFFYAAKVRRYDNVPYCIEDWAPAFDPIRHDCVVLLYALPLLVIAVLYSVIAAKVWNKRTPGNTTAANRRVSQEYKKNVLKMSIAVVLAFAFCWFLMHLNQVLLDFSRALKIKKFQRCVCALWHTFMAPNNRFFAWSRQQRHQLLHIPDI